MDNISSASKQEKSTRWQSAPGHQVLAAAGKKILRPGGRTATEQLLTWANLQPGQTVLELASSFGESAIALVKRYHVSVVGVEKNPDSVAKAEANIAKVGLSNSITIINGDIFQLDEIPQQFDAVLAEAILTMQSPSGKNKIINGVYSRLKPGGKFLSHELLVKENAEEVCQALRQAIRVNATPLSTEAWISMCEEVGLTLIHQQTGKMGLLHLPTMLQDEGIKDTLKIFGNILTRPSLRQRILEMRRVFLQYQQQLGYIILCVQKGK